ncbi:MAG: histidine phosphatase family protein [Deltaproteobacteria bacterium]|nr:histidine phosphatase family protein [Deltaproteobacteria bacterium]
MKTLYVMRHANAEQRGPDGTDFSRRLTPQGQAEARSQGEMMRDKGLLPDLIKCSAGARALETAREVAQVLGRGTGTPELREDKRLYNAPGGDIYEVLRELEAGVAAPLVVAHMPGVAELVWALLKPDSEANGSFSTATVVQMELEIDSWDELKPGVGNLLLFAEPRS